MSTTATTLEVPLASVAYIITNNDKEHGIRSRRSSIVNVRQQNRKRYVVILPLAYIMTFDAMSLSHRSSTRCSAVQREQ